MNMTTRPAAAMAALALSTSPLLLTVPAAADTSGPSKAAIEHAERQATGPAGLTKAQIEQREREQARPGTPPGPRTGPEPAPTSGDGGAAAWQLALSAALGAVMAGGVLVVARQVGSQRGPVASAH